MCGDRGGVRHLTRSIVVEIIREVLSSVSGEYDGTRVCLYEDNLDELDFLTKVCFVTHSVVFDCDVSSSSSVAAKEFDLRLPLPPQSALSSLDKTVLDLYSASDLQVKFSTAFIGLKEEKKKSVKMRNNSVEV